ncbi:hypothetical protein HUG10_12290 [Halorarum halophilum]|uniref:Uncharacterized protein n=1 Tax=Halorarum halophilum TaxID=2743090 RepID=A0A7D5K8I0_9EURY|nr:hypothetical protein [Halobaculum halophilum]QLG28279.1 hypothetical protein HUG10_12290 [Halobaculum halophilum]
MCTFDRVGFGSPFDRLPFRTAKGEFATTLGQSHPLPETPLPSGTVPGRAAVLGKR